jgi:hypothetical protein
MAATSSNPEAAGDPSLAACFGWSADLPSSVPMF